MKVPHDAPAPPARPEPAEFWRRIQDDFVAGMPAALVAHRYGVSERTVRRKAAEGGWRRCDHTVATEPPSRRRGYLDIQTIAARFPEFAEVQEATAVDAALLLFTPDQRYLRQFAFKRAAECAAMDRASEAVVWMRLVQQLDRSGARIENEAIDASEADMLRVALLRRMSDDTRMKIAAAEEAARNGHGAVEGRAGAEGQAS